MSNASRRPNCRWARSNDAISSLTPFHIEQAGGLAYVLEICSTSAGPATTMLVLRRDGAGAWRICAEAVVPS